MNGQPGRPSPGCRPRRPQFRPPATPVVRTRSFGYDITSFHVGTRPDPPSTPPRPVRLPSTGFEPNDPTDERPQVLRTPDPLRRDRGVDRPRRPDRPAGQERVRQVDAVQGPDGRGTPRRGHRPP